MTVVREVDALSWGLRACVVLARALALTEAQFLRLTRESWRVVTVQETPTMADPQQTARERAGLDR